MAGAQIRRFLILPKELDPDDGELTGTQKVRRRFIAERYTSVIEISTAQPARLRSRPRSPMKTAAKACSRRRCASSTCRPIRRPQRLPQREGRNRRHLACGRARLADLWRSESDLRRVVRHPQRRDTGAIIGPNGSGKTSMLNVAYTSFYHPQKGAIRWRGRARARMKPYEAAVTRHRANVSKRCAVQRHDDAR